MEDNELGTNLIGCAIQVHRAPGRGLLESVYETCLHHELSKAGVDSKRQVFLPFEYDGLQVDNAFRVDVIVGDRLIVQISSGEDLDSLIAANDLSEALAPTDRPHIKLQRHSIEARRNQASG
jgi:GxxExxY protein